MNTAYIDDLYYSYGYYFGEIRVDPNHKNKIYLGGIPILKSEDGGMTFESISAPNVHADHHALWINPKKTGHLINGNDGGVNITYDDGAHWIKNNSPSVGQFYAINIDYEEPYNVYGGLQDNGVWKGPHNAKESPGWHQSGHYPWKSILGGDGMQVQIDRRDHNIVYTGFQFGNYYRLNVREEKSEKIQPKHALGEKPYRFNWQTPILLSTHNQDILYMGADRLLRSMNQGGNWEPISQDLTEGGKKGNVAFGTLTTISESPLTFGLIYTGSDDGLIHVSKNSGGSWEKISVSLPEDLWVSRVVASKHKKERVYASLNGYRWDDFNAYLYKSEDYGKTWKNIASGVPFSPVNVILEDPVNENLLYAGTDNGLYLSLDQGDSWELFQNGIPAVAIHDLVIQPVAGHLLVGTHGRSIYQADVSTLQKLTPELLKETLVVFDVKDIKHAANWGNPGSAWSKADTPGVDITFFAAGQGSCTVKVSTLDGVVVSEAELEADKGLNIMSYDVAFSKKGKLAYQKKYKKELKESKNGKTYLPQGKYTVNISGNGASQKVTFEIVSP